jgi:hypothetical protein
MYDSYLRSTRVVELAKAQSAVFFQAGFSAQVRSCCPSQVPQVQGEDISAVNFNADGTVAGTRALTRQEARMLLVSHPVIPSS